MTSRPLRAAPRGEGPGTADRAQGGHEPPRHPLTGELRPERGQEARARPGGGCCAAGEGARQRASGERVPACAQTLRGSRSCPSAGAALLWRVAGLGLAAARERRGSGSARRGWAGSRSGQPKTHRGSRCASRLQPEDGRDSDAWSSRSPDVKCWSL